MKLKGGTTLTRILIFLIIFITSQNVDGFTISGVIYNSFDRTTLTGATVELKTPGSNITVTSAVSDKGGRYSINYSEGTFLVQVKSDGKFDGLATIALNANYQDFDFALLTVRSGNDLEFSLYWGASPKDLDVYVFTPWNCEISFVNNPCQRGNAIGRFGYQDSNGWGPESVILTGATDGRYEMWVSIYTSTNEVFSPDANKLPVAFVTTRFTRVITPVQVPTTKDPALKWWRVARIDVLGTDITVTYPNTVQTSRPDYPFPQDTPITTGSVTTQSQFVTTSASSSSSGETTATGPVTTSSYPSITTGIIDNNPGTPGGTPGGNPSGSSNISAPFNTPGCTDEEALYCQIVLNECSDAGQNLDKLCGCFSNLGFCLRGYGCFVKFRVGFERECTNSMCGDDLCYQFGDEWNNSNKINVNYLILSLLLFVVILY